MSDAELEIAIRHHGDGYAADVRFSSPTHDVLPATNIHLIFDLDMLRSLSLDPDSYGEALSATLFADQRLRAAWQQARAVAQQMGVLRFRLRLDMSAPELHALAWELLRDPEQHAPLALSEQVRFSRYLESTDFSPLHIPLRPALRALVVVSNPSDLGRFQLTEIDVEGEVARAQAALGDIPTTIVGAHPAAQHGHATLAAITAALRDGPQLVLLIAHGTLVKDEAYLWLEDEGGRADRVSGTVFVEALAQLPCRPLLLVLAACQSGGNSNVNTLAALGPRLARAGVAGVLAFQGYLPVRSLRRLLPPLFGELRRDGRIDRALAAARGALRQHAEWWLPVLWLRVRDGQLWYMEPPPAPAAPMIATDPLPLEAPEGTMHTESRFYVERQPADRVALTSAHAQYGSTLTIKGPRQVGKSSLLIRVMAAAGQAGKHVAYLDFQQFDEAARADADTFFLQFVRWLGDELGLAELRTADWPLALGTMQRCTRYVERTLLPALDGPLLLAMDEVDSILDCPFRTDFFAMLRVWHNNRAMPNRPIWRKLDLALVTSTEPYQLVENLNQSPFNVGEVIELSDFDANQVTQLNALHGQPFVVNDAARIYELLNGHPYLTRRALYLVADGRLSTAELFAQADSENGPFGEHLRRHQQRLTKRPDLAQVFRQILLTQRTSDDQAFWRLRGAGLVRRDGERSLARCRLYADYFTERLR
ncbi:AAA-like domain-containing protein [Candidatus Oscillochloris fontis]|uniref:AAA-like domain-containing protein n=1 Tax=Candidatus Oscillochloris fontis TaxID=2496868 RepID=UPI00101D6535|nr:AAA-like domain-containing protein [Candidatus Oscillochloris fontis]